MRESPVRRSYFARPALRHCCKRDAHTTEPWESVPRRPRVQVLRHWFGIKRHPPGAAATAHKDQSERRHRLIPPEEVRDVKTESVIVMIMIMIIFTIFIIIII